MHGYDEKGWAEYDRIIADERERNRRKLYAMYALVASGDIPEVVTGVKVNLSDQQLLKRTGIFRTIMHLTEDMDLALRLAGSRSATGAARKTISRYETLTMDDFENAATKLGVHDDLWPHYRFQNVDLLLPEAA